MIECIHVELAYDGDRIRVQHTVLPEAHALGMSAGRSVQYYRMFDSVGQDEGVVRIQQALTRAVEHLVTEVALAWGCDDPGQGELF